MEGKTGGKRKSAKERRSCSPLAAEMLRFVMDQWPLIAMQRESEAGQGHVCMFIEHGEELQW